MMKRVFKISLIVTVVSLLITLVLLPFGVRSMLDTANKWAEYTTYEVEYEQPAGGVTQVNVKFTGREWMSCGVEQQSSGENITLSTSGLQLYDITTTSETDGTVLNLTVDFQVKPEFEQLASLARVSNMIQTNLKVPLGVAVSFDESSCQISSYVSQDDQHWVMSGFHDYAQEPLTWNSTIREALYQYAVGAYTRAEFDSAFDRAAADILADVNDTVRNSERAAASEATQWEYAEPMEPDYDNGESAYTEVIIDKGEEYGSKTLPENTAALVEAYLDAVQEYLAVSVDCWCAMNSNTIPALKTVDTSLDTLRSQRTVAQQKVTEARRALADAVDGCVYHEYIYSALQLG